VIDGRLLLPAGAAWSGAYVGGVVGWPQSLALALLAVVALLVATSAGVRGFAVVHRAPWPPRPPRRLAVVTTVCLLAGMLAALMQATALAAEPLASWAQARATATVVAVVTGEPVRRTSPGRLSWQDSSRLEVRIASEQVTARGVTVDVAVPILLRLPDGSTVPAPGSTVVVSGRLGPAGSPDLAAAVTPIAEGVRVIGEPGWLDAWAHAMRAGLLTSLSGTAPDGGALVAGLAVGDESLASDELVAAMRSSGLSHLTAVSGGNVAIVVVVVLGASALLGLPLAARVAVALGSLAFFVVLVGPQPSVLRASVMGAVVLAGLLVGGRRAGPSVLAASVLVLVIVSPALARSWAFALSVGATVGLILLAPRLRGALDGSRLSRRWPPGLREAVAVTSAAQLATLPVLVLMGASVGWVALPANLLAMPVVPAVTVLGLGAAMAAPVAPVAGHVLAVAASWPAGWIAGVAGVASGLPLAQAPLPTGGTGLLVLAALAAAGWLIRRWSATAFPHGAPRGFVAVLTAAGVSVAALWLALPADRRSWPPEDWLLIMCDVGQGDALLLRSGEGAAVVVDAGPDPARIDACLSSAGIRDIPAVVLTHFHADHVEGLSGVLRGRRVGEVLVTPVRDPPEEADFVEATLARVGLSAQGISAGDERQAGAVRWRALWPRRVIEAGSVPNNASIVLAVSISGRMILLTGDVEAEAQVAVMPLLQGLRPDVVKVPHHGSRVQAAGFPTAAPAAVALVSVGAGNPYGHPAPETIAAWQAVGALVVRTDQAGDVAVVKAPVGVAVVARSGMLPP
jgi:competence protein ComEC